jgi:sterol desaturase/sphingolipid hydroxylase (fatty acid hydroxylase superfamily)
MTGFFQGISPCISHSGFDYLKLGRLRIKTGDWYHQLHHQYFNLNYGNTPTPLDKVFGSWHDGSPQSLAVQKARVRERRRAAT